MIETMREYQGIGLAAPQVHQDKRLLVVELKSPRGSDLPAVPLTILFNIKITEQSDVIDEDWEAV